MKHVRDYCRRTVYALTLSLIGWVVCSTPVDGDCHATFAVCRVVSWPVRAMLAGASAAGIRNEPLSLGWCDFCSPQVKLYRAVGTGVLTYLIVLYLLAAMKTLWLRKRRSTREAAATTNTVQQT
jgi:hypothetical protein